MQIINSPTQAMAPRWSADHLRLHQQLLRQPLLLPQGARLLLAVSGGQDSMALAGLLLDLKRLHHWCLHIWHGNHRWRQEANQQAEQLLQWAESQEIESHCDSWQTPIHTEAAAREWRYSCLEKQAKALACSHVLTAHTATDRSETVLLHLARGSHRKGLASLSSARTLVENITLVRPLLCFSRSDTSRICAELGLPIWLDPSNTDLRFSRNRIRAEVLPVLEQLHPGASRRIAAMAERFEAEEESQQQLLDLALQTLLGAEMVEINKKALLALKPANQAQILLHWLSKRKAKINAAYHVEKILQELKNKNGRCALDNQSLFLEWDNKNIWLNSHPDCNESRQRGILGAQP
ncbi:MAG: tRNA lysidine(34) synthetase TilS [Cyanobacteriota bacterium]|jgi:tRNA(Ile)-lysidine synthase